MTTTAEGRPEPGSAMDQELSSVQSTARWLVGAGAAILAALVAGLQLSAVARLTFDTTAQLLLATGAFLVALLSILGLLVLAARVLIHPGWTLNKMVDQQQANPQDWKEHWLRKELNSRRGLLVPDSDFDPGLMWDRHRYAFAAWSDMQQTGEAELSDDIADPNSPVQTYKASNPTDVERLGQRLQDAAATTQRVETAANLAEVRKRYRLLVRLLPVVGLLPVAALLYLVWSAATSSDVQLSTPVAVRIQFNKNPSDVTAAGLPQECTGLSIDGIAMGGSLSKPTVVSNSNARCVINQVEIPKSAGVVVPVIPPK